MSHPRPRCRVSEITLVILLGLGSGLGWGVADFLGGLQARRLPVLTVVLWSQLAGGLAMLIVLLAGGGPPARPVVAWGVAAGICGGSGLALFYRGLANGAMSIVAPVSACGAIVPVAVAFSLGEAPSAISSAGIVTAIAGVVLVSLPSQTSVHPSGNPAEVLVLGLGAALGFGLFFVFADRGTASATPGGGSPLWVLVGARAGSLLTLLGLISVGPRSVSWPGRRIGHLAAIGVLDTTANALFAIASTLGNLGVASVLSSLYPVTTVLLARLVLAERLGAVQTTGVALALAGVALLAAG